MHRATISPAVPVSSPGFLEVELLPPGANPKKYAYARNNNHVACRNGNCDNRKWTTDMAREKFVHIYDDSYEKEDKRSPRTDEPKDSPDDNNADSASSRDDVSCLDNNSC